MGKINGTLIILFYVNPSSPQLQGICFFVKNHSLTSDWWENTKSYFKENARTFSINSTTQKNTRISRLKKYYEAYTKMKI